MSGHGGDGSVQRDVLGRVSVRLPGGQGSHVVSALTLAGTLAIVPEDVDGLLVGGETALWWVDRA